MAIKFSHAAFQRKINLQHTKAKRSYTKQQMCCKNSQLNALWTALPRPQNLTKKSKAQLNFALNTWACGYANFSLVSWFCQLWVKESPDLRGLCEPRALPLFPLLLFLLLLLLLLLLVITAVASLFVAMIVRFFNQIGARLWGKLSCWNVETIIRA